MPSSSARMVTSSYLYARRPITSRLSSRCKTAASVLRRKRSLGSCSRSPRRPILVCVWAIVEIGLVIRPIYGLSGARDHSPSRRDGLGEKDRYASLNLASAPHHVHFGRTNPALPEPGTSISTVGTARELGRDVEDRITLLNAVCLGYP